VKFLSSYAELGLKKLSVTLQVLYFLLLKAFHGLNGQSLAKGAAD